jgi:hypothetical protein
MRPLRASQVVGSFVAMSDTTTTETGLGEQPVSDAATTAQDTSEQQVSGDISSKFSGLSEAEQNAILFPDEDTDDGDYQSDSTTPPTATDDAPPAQPESTGDTASPSPKAPKRVSVRALPDDQQVLVARAVEMVRNGEAPDILAATAILGGSQPVKDEAAGDEAGTQTPSTETTTGEANPIATIQSRLDDLRAEREQAILDFNGGEQAQLTNQIEDVLAELAEAKAIARLQAKEAETKAQSQQQEYQQAVEEIEAAYPELQDDDSAFSRVFDGMVASARARNPQAYGNGAELRELAEEVAQILGTKTAAAPQTRSPLPAQPRPSTPNGSAVAPGHTQAHRMTADEARRFIQNASPEQLDALVDAFE